MPFYLVKSLKSRVYAPLIGEKPKEKEPVVRSDAPLIGEEPPLIDEEPRAVRGPDYTSLFWCEWRESNPHGCYLLAPKASASASSATLAKNMGWWVVQASNL